MHVPLNDFRRQWDAVRRDAVAAFRRVGASGWYILGEEVRRFEQALERAWPAAHAVGVGSGLDALEIGLRSLGVTSGDAVLTTPLSAFATTLAVIRVGAVPVFVDVDATGLVDLGRCREVLRDRPEIRCFLPVHLYGHALDLQALRSLRDEFELHIVEDCAQSIGARHGGMPTGSVGQVAATSFYPTKNLGAMGDGGAVLTGFAEIAEKARALRHYGQTATYVHDLVGLNSRLDEVHAAILTDALLPRLSGWTERRRQIAARYREGLEARRICVPPATSGSEPVWHLFPVLLPPGRRVAFMDHLRRQGVMAGVHYPNLIPEQGAMRQHGRFEVVGELDNATRFVRDEVSLPIHPFLTEEEIEQVITACNSWSGE